MKSTTSFQTAKQTDIAKDFVLKGNICYSRNLTSLITHENGYLVCVAGKSAGVFASLPEQYRNLPICDYGKNCVIIPGLTDLHVHAPQFAFRGLGMDMELLDWLNTHTFPEEAKYEDLEYAQRAYRSFVADVARGPNTRAVVFATVHVPATELLMDMLERSGLVTMVGKVNMDRNAPPELLESSAEASAQDTLRWLEETAGRDQNTYPILTPRFVPSCSDALMERIGEIQEQAGLPVQSHLSENLGEIAWVRELCPQSAFYGDAYDHYGLFGGTEKDRAPTVMAHCVHSDLPEIKRMRRNGVYIAHCPQSNTNLSSGIAPVRKFLNAGIRVGLGSDVAGGSDTSILRVMRSAIEVSKLRWRLIDSEDRPLTVEEAFYLGTVGGGSFFGKAGSFEPGCEFDAVVIDDGNLAAPFQLSVADRLARIIYYADERNLKGKYARGCSIPIATS